MSRSDDELADLIRALPPAPAHLVERVKQLPAHSEPPEADDRAEDDTDPLTDVDDTAPGEHEGDGVDENFDGGDSLDGGASDDPSAG